MEFRFTINFGTLSNNVYISTPSLKIFRLIPAPEEDLRKMGILQRELQVSTVLVEAERIFFVFAPQVFKS